MVSWLSPDQFSQACAALPLVSLDFCLLRPGMAGTELLLGLRNNRPAQGWWFTPGGRIRKNEPLASASARIALDELSLPAAALTLPQGPDQQHARWQWLPLDQAARDESVHAYMRVYAQWLLDKTS